MLREKETTTACDPILQHDSQRRPSTDQTVPQNSPVKYHHPASTFIQFDDQVVLVNFFSLFAMVVALLGLLALDDTKQKHTLPDIVLHQDTRLVENQAV